MQSRLPLKRSSLPILLLLAASLLVGLFVFDDFGLSWDEPLFYQYSDSIRSAYSIQARLDGTLDLEEVYGPSATDHKIYGPAYILIAQTLVDGLDRILEVPRADLWHFINYLTFISGALLLYGLCLRWVSPLAAFERGIAIYYPAHPLGSRIYQSERHAVYGLFPGSCLHRLSAG